MRGSARSIVVICGLAALLFAAPVQPKGKKAVDHGDLTLLFGDGTSQTVALRQPASSIVRLEFSRAEAPAKVERGKSFDGKWDGDWGKLEFKVYGNRAFGEYAHDKGRAIGFLSADGKTLEGFWLEAPTYTPPNDGGRFLYRLSDDGKKISGQWWYGEHDKARDWSSKRAKR